MIHDFLLVDRETDGEWSLLRFIHDPRNLLLHDDFLRYIIDTLAWIPTVNPARRESEQRYGLCFYGPTLIEADGAKIAGPIFANWANLFSLGPPELILTGSWTMQLGDDEETTEDNYERVVFIRDEEKPSKSGYERLVFNRDETVATLRQIASWCEIVANGGGRYFLYHGGI